MPQGQQGPRIIATFQPQVAVDNSVYDQGDPVEVDVTERVLEMKTKEINEIGDDDYTSDPLVRNDERRGHAGPFRVAVRQSIDAFFAHHGLDPSTVGEEGLAALRERLGIDGEREYEVEVSRTSARYAKIRVRASSAEEAEALAIDKAGDVDFHDKPESGVEYEVVTQVAL